MKLQILESQVYGMEQEKNNCGLLHKQGVAIYVCQ
jgi:hypothetical protein